jgi:hypothetical protein
MPFFTLLTIFLLLFIRVQAQFVSDSVSLKKPILFLDQKPGYPLTRSFSTSFSAYEANIFNPLLQSSNSNFRINAGVSQSFFLNPAQNVWVGNRPQTPITASPVYPNFVPLQISPSISVHSKSGTFYSFSQGAFQGNGFNPLFRGVNIVKPLGGRKP